MEKHEQVDPPPSGAGQPVQAAQDLWQRWRQGQGPTLQEVLAHADELTAGQLAVAVAADQYQNWQQGKRTRAEVYLQQYPGLCADEEAACNLVYGEFLLQQELGEAPSLQEYLDRFPRLADGLNQLHQYAQFNSVLHWLPLQSATELNDQANQAEPANSPGVVFAGRYTLVEKLGAGGMGEVWVAKQTEPVKRNVALKLIKAGMDSKTVLARFEAERQALALMDHANIAKVLDGGITPAGHPFFVMELVDGLPLTKFCDNAKLTLRQRLELFVPICQAVQHAHQKGIVHRDLKPSNILITLYEGQPTPKVIDFGVAKAVAGRLTDESLTTQYGGVVGTLDYMAPEQAGRTAIDIDTRADIYSLGVILYELLTGLRPFEAKRLGLAALDELIRIIREEEPSKPSTRLSSDESLPSLAALRQTEPKRLTALLRGELDCIVMKALEKDRNRRYETANAFARDIQRYLADEPVEAQPPSMRYRLGKFVRRNKELVMATSLVLFMLLVGTAGIIWYQNEEAKRATAEVVRHAEADRKQALAEQAVGAALDQAEKSQAELHQILGKPGGVFQLLNEPRRWQAHIQLAQAGVARAKALLANADGSVKPDLNTRIQHLQAALGQADADRLLAVRLEKIRMERSATFDGKLDPARAAEEYFTAFVEAQFAVLKEESAAVAARVGVSPIRDQLVAALDDWASVAFILRKEGLSEQLLTIARLAAPDPAWGDRVRQMKVWRDPQALTGLMKEAPGAGLSPQLLQLIGALRLEDNAAKESWHRQAQAQHPADFFLNLHLGAILLDKNNPVEAAGFFRVCLAVRPGSSVAYNNLGCALRDEEKLPEAIDAFNKAIAIDPKLALAYNNLGRAFFAQKKLPEAIAAFNNAVVIDPKFAHAYNNLGKVLREQKQFAKAIDAYNKAIDLDPKSSSTYYNLGIAFAAQKKLPEAIDAYHKAIAIDPKFTLAYNNLGTAFAAQKKLPEAIDAFNKAIAIDPKHAKAYHNLGSSFREQKQLAKAVEAYRKAIDLNPKYALAYYGLGNVLYEQKKLPEAIDAYHKAIDLNPKDSAAYNNLGVALHEQKNLAEAVAALNKAIDLNPKDSSAYNNLGWALREQQKLPEAIDALNKAIAIDPKFALAYKNLGLALGDQKKLPEAIDAFNKAIDLNPKDSAAYNNLGCALRDQAKVPEAIDAFNKAIAIDAKFAQAYTNLGTVFAAQNKLPEAIAAFHNAIEIDPKFADGHSNLGTALRKQKKLHEAIAASRKAIAINPSHANAYMNLGQALYEQKRLPEACEAYYKLIRIDPKYPSAYNNLGVALHEQKKPAEAVDAYRKAIEVNPKDHDAYQNLGNVLREQKQLVKAIDAYRKAIDLNPKHARAYYGLGNVLHDQKKLPEAIDAYHKAIDFDPKLAGAYHMLGKTLVDEKKLPEAIGAFRKLIAIDPKFPNGYYSLGAALGDQKKLPEAIEAYRKAIEVNPKNAMAYNNLGNALRGQKKLPEALDAFHKAIDIDPKQVFAYFNLGNTLRDQKKLSEAIDAYQKGIGVNAKIPYAHANLGNLLLLQGDFAMARESTQRAVELLPENHTFRPLYLNQVDQCRKLEAMEKRLHLVLAGQEPVGSGVRVDMAEMCRQYKKRYPTAVQLYQEAFKVEPALAEDEAHRHRYHAACAAALAGLGQGDEAAKLTEEEKSKLRRQARDWLQADLSRYVAELKNGKVAVILKVEKRLSHWQADAELAGVRDAKALAALPDEEHKAWQKLWADVAGSLKEGRSRSTETRVQGELTEREKSKVHKWNLVAGRTYVIDLESTAFDTLLKLQDPRGKLLAENDDIVPGVKFNSQLIFTPPVDGVYGIVATSFQQAGAGPYTLRIREFKVAK